MGLCPSIFHPVHLCLPVKGSSLQRLSQKLNGCAEGSGSHAEGSGCSHLPLLVFFQPGDSMCIDGRPMFSIGQILKASLGECDRKLPT